MSKRVNNITEVIGNTPLVKLNRVVPEGAADIYVKLEYQNPGSSVKDRIALAMIEAAEAAGELKAGIRLLNRLPVTRGLVLRWSQLLKAIKLYSLCLTQ